MEPQSPADGVMKLGQYSTGTLLRVACTCGDESHDHTIDVEKDCDSVVVSIYTRQTSKFWESVIENRYDINNRALELAQWKWADIVNGLWHRVKQTYQLWVKGYIEFESSLILTEQQALNYATALQVAVKETAGKDKY